MRTRSILIAGLAAAILAACDDSGERAAETPAAPPGEAAEPSGTSGDRAERALGEAGEAARQTMEKLGEAGQAGIEALEENAPAIRENIGEAGERLRNAADALVTDPDAPAVDLQGDSGADADEVPEQLETPAR